MAILITSYLQILCHIYMEKEILKILIPLIKAVTKIIGTMGLSSYIKYIIQSCMALIMALMLVI